MAGPDQALEKQKLKSRTSMTTQSIDLTLTTASNSKKIMDLLTEDLSLFPQRRIHTGGRVYSEEGTGARRQSIGEERGVATSESLINDGAEITVLLLFSCTPK